MIYQLVRMCFQDVSFMAIKFEDEDQYYNFLRQNGQKYRFFDIDTTAEEYTCFYVVRNTSYDEYYEKVVCGVRNR